MCNAVMQNDTRSHQASIYLHSVSILKKVSINAAADSAAQDHAGQPDSLRRCH